MNAQPPGDVYLDTSALVDLKLHPERAFPALRAILAPQRRLVVPLVTLHEALSHAKPEVAAATLDTLERLVVEHGCVTNEPLQDVVALELARKRFAAAPVVELNALLPVLRSQFHDAGTREALLAKIDQFLGKDRSFDLDRSHAPSFRAALPKAVPTDLREIRANLRDWVSHSYFFRLFVPSSHRLEARKRPKAYRTAVTLAAMVFLQALSAGFSGRSKPPDVLELFPDVKRNDGVDLRIVASAAYARVFVSNDTTQRRRVDAIAGAFGFPLRSASLREK